MIALDHLDEVIKTDPRSRQDPAGAPAALMENFKLSELQAQAILDMRLQRLTGFERDKIIAEHKEVLALIERLKAILASDKLVLEIIVGELEETKRRFADPRRTELLRKRPISPSRTSSSRKTSSSR